MSETSTTPASTDIGVLVVHGIGNQRPNSTLDEFNDSLVGSLRRWLGPSAVVTARQPADGDVPAHAHVTIADPDGEPMHALVAEGYWADTVRTPTPGTLLRWLLAVVPFVVPRVLDGGLRRNSMRMDRLRKSRDHPVRGLVTLGSAIARLGAVSHLRDSPWSYAGAFALRICSAVLLVVAALATGPWSDGDVRWPPVLLAAAAASFSAARAAMRRIVRRAHVDPRPRMESRHVARWVDFYTAADPVPEGALPIEPAWGYSREIVNCRIPLLDHVRYWSNVQAFCASVVLELAEMAGRPCSAELHEAVATAAGQRAKALARRVWVRGALIIAAITAVAGNHARPMSLVVATATIAAAIALDRVLGDRAKVTARDWAPYARRRARAVVARQG